MTEKMAKIPRREGGVYMLRGCQKQVVVLKGKNGDIFEEAHFILRTGGRAVGLPELLCEANRIVEATKPCVQKKNGNSANALKFIFFVMGLLTGAGLVLLSAVLT